MKIILRHVGINSDFNYDVSGVRNSLVSINYLSFILHNYEYIIIYCNYLLLGELRFTGYAVRYLKPSITGTWRVSETI